MVSRDAGSKTAIQHIKTLNEMGFHVVFFPTSGVYDEEAASELLELDMEIDAGYFQSKLRYLAAQGTERFSFVFLNRPLVARSYFLQAGTSSTLKTIYFGHDLHHLRLGMQFLVTRNEDIKKEAACLKALEEYVWKNSHVITYPTLEEVEYVRKIAPTLNVQLLQPYAYPSFEYRDKAPDNLDIVFVGSFQHSPNLDAARRLVFSIFPKIKECVPTARLKIIGSNMPYEVHSWQGAGVMVLGWLSTQELQDQYQLARLAVVPLEYGAGLKLKVVEALSVGVPVVTTSVGAQGLPGLSGIANVADSNELIAAAAIAILQDSENKWVGRSQASIDFVKANFSQASMYKNLTEVLNLLR